MSKSNLRRIHNATLRSVGVWLDKRGRRVCACGGYHFPHRRGGGACDHSKTQRIHLAIRMKDQEALLDALVSYAFEHPGKPFAGPCPF